MHNKIFLIIEFTIRDLKERYIGTGLGNIWFILSPLVMIFIYSIIFSDFMKMKLNIVDNSYAYSIYLIPGLFSWTAFNNTLMRLNTSFFEKANLIKKISVPMYIFQISITFAEFTTFFISMLLGVFFLLIIHQPITVDLFIIIPIMILQTIFSFGLGVIISLFTPFIKDLKEIIPIILQIWFWMTPIVYVRNIIEKKYPYILTYNPFYYFARTYQDLFLYDKLPTFNSIIIMIAESILVILIAIVLYKKMIGTIKDII